jgi:hypothetical protein
MSQARNKEAGGKQSKPCAENQDLNMGQEGTSRDSMAAYPLSAWSSKGTNSKQERSNSLTLKRGGLLLQDVGTSGRDVRNMCEQW